jgi:hypothetical protein
MALADRNRSIIAGDTYGILGEYYALHRRSLGIGFALAELFVETEGHVIRLLHNPSQKILNEPFFPKLCFKNINRINLIF